MEISIPPEFCILDIETSPGDFNRIPESFQLLVTGVLWQGGHQFYGCTTGELRGLLGFLRDFEGTVVTFNGGRFDLPILNDHLFRLTGEKLEVRKHYDILAEFTKAAGHRISLDNLARETLGRQKVAWDHRRNVQVWEEEPERLRQYLRVDLDLTAALYEKVLRREPLSDGSKQVFLPTQA